MKMDDELMESVPKKKGLTTIEDVKECLRKDFADEVMDANKYLQMAEMVEAAGEDSYYFVEMAKDEYTHAKFICEYLEMNSVHIPGDQKRCFEKLEAEISKYFRVE